jgi:TolA-binding protein
MSLARNEERRGSNEQAVRYYLLVGLLFDDAKLVPEALSSAATLLEKLGRPAEAQSTREELKKRYPQAPAPAKTAQCATGAKEVA